MKKLFISLLLLITGLSSQVEASLLFGSKEIQGLLAAYNFNKEKYAHVIDQGIQGINGVLDGDAKLVKGKYGNSLLLEAPDDRFIALKTAPSRNSIELYYEHTICAWVKIPKQDTDFRINLQFIDPITFSAAPVFETETVAGTEISVKPNGNLGAVSYSVYFGDYYIDSYVEPKPEPVPEESQDEPEVDEDSDVDTSFFTNGLYLETTDQSINDDSWHYITLVYGQKCLKLYVDGKNVYESEYYPGHLWNPLDYVILISVGDGAIGAVDDLCIFHYNLDDAYIELLYELGIDKIMTIADVESKGKMATTWGDLKSRQ